MVKNRRADRARKFLALGILSGCAMTAPAVSGPLFDSPYLLTATEPQSQSVREVTQELATLLRADQAAEAADLAAKASPEYAGLPEFDFVAGIVFSRAGRYEEAVVHLERVLIVQPGHDRARVEYARALFGTGDLVTARSNFQRVLDRDPPDTVQARVERFIAAIDRQQRRQQPVSGYWVEGRLGYDNNVDASSGEDFDILGIPFEDSTDSDTFYQLDFGYSHRNPRGAQGHDDAEVTVSARNYFDEGDADLIRVDGTAGPTWRLNQRDQASLKGRFGYVRRSAEGVLRSVYALEPEWRRVLDARTQLQVGGHVGYNRYSAINDRDSYTLRSTGMVIRALDEQGRLIGFAGGLVGYEKADADFYTRYSVGGFTGATWAPTTRHELTASVGIQRENYDEGRPEAMFLDPRAGEGAERAWLGQATLRYAYSPEGSDWSAVAGALYAEKDSNLDTASYDRTEVYAGARYRWE